MTKQSSEDWRKAIRVWRSLTQEELAPLLAERVSGAEAGLFNECGWTCTARLEFLLANPTISDTHTTRGGA